MFYTYTLKCFKVNKVIRLHSEFREKSDLFSVDIRENTRDITISEHRYYLDDRVESRAGDRIGAVDIGVREEYR